MFFLYPFPMLTFVPGLRMKQPKDKYNTQLFLDHTVKITFKIYHIFYKLNIFVEVEFHFIFIQGSSKVGGLYNMMEVAQKGQRINFTE